MNVRHKVQVLNIALGIMLALIFGLLLSSFFTYSKLHKASTKALKQQLFLFERSMEDVRTCLDAEEYTLAKIKLAEALQLLKDSRSAAQSQPEIQKSFAHICKKYCRIWNATEWGYSYQASDHPALQKGFETICQ